MPFRCLISAVTCKGRMVLPGRPLVWCPQRGNFPLPRTASPGNVPSGFSGKHGNARSPTGCQPATCRPAKLSPELSSAALAGAAW